MIEEKGYLAQVVAENIIYYRKKLNLTQLELAEKLNYSDKSISKWERAEGIPDIFVMKQLSHFFGITIDDLTNKRKKRVTRKILKMQISYFYASIVWLIAGVLFGLFTLIDLDYPNWHLFIFALPLSSLILLIFYLVWSQKREIYVYLTTFIWTLPLALNYIINTNKNGYLFILMAPIYLFMLYLITMIYKRK